MSHFLKSCSEILSVLHSKNLVHELMKSFTTDARYQMEIIFAISLKVTSATKLFFVINQRLMCN